ncbi:MAG: hypothetical protein WBE76_22615 [Terracidiphilus sp.]
MVLTGLGAAVAQESPEGAPPAPVYAQLVEQLRAQDARLKELEAEVGQLRQAQAGQPGAAAQPANTEAAAAADAAALTAASSAPVAPAESGGHDMSMTSGPTLNIRGFFDYNFGVGSIANPLVFPIIDDGCETCGNPPTPPHSAFQADEFDLFMTSKLADRLSFLAEMVFGPDTTNEFSIDIERYTLTYKANRYFSANAGRVHTSIGYYNTAYHHGNWFSTATGRPIMYLFEDSGGILPVHLVGLSFTGAVPKTQKLGLHWVGEVGNGLSSNSYVAESVQNFYSDRNYKATNIAAYIKPELLPGAQIGGSWYHDGLNPTGVPEVRQNIESAHVVFFNSAWESMTEGVMLSNHLMGTPAPLRSPMAYTQVARKFGIYKPYFRYQYVRDNPKDPVNLLKGTYYGPSIGLRTDFSEYVAFKLQFNHLFESNQSAGNGLDSQLAFTF